MTEQKKPAEGGSSRRQFLTLSAASLLGASCRTVPPREEVVADKAPNLVVFVSDALRADHLSCYGYKRPTTPEIDKFSEESFLFEQCHSAATWTTPATVTLLTGTSPMVHQSVIVEWSEEGRQRNRYHVLSESILTTAECLARKGYRTGYFQSNPNADERRGHARGCHDYYFKVGAASAVQMDVVLEWLATRAREPFYAYIHMIDPHKPHKVSPEVFADVHGQTLASSIAEVKGPGRERLTSYHTFDWSTSFTEGKALLANELRTFSNSALEHVMKLYDGEVRGIDGEFRRLLTGLEDLGLMKRTVVVLTSDHGEAFGEEEQFNHGGFLHDPQTHVPLIVRLPGQETGTRVPWTVRQCDLHPTLLTLARARIPSPCTGASLLSDQGKLLVSEDRAAFTTLDRDHSSMKLWDFGLAKGSLRVRTQKSGKTLEVFDLLGEPGAIVRHELDPASRDPRIRSVIQQLYGVMADNHRIFKPSYAPTWGNEPFEEVSTAALEALGYL